MRKTRWAWYLLMSGIGVVGAEGLSWSTPIIYPAGLFVLIVYGLHYLLIVDFLAARNAITRRGLAVGGVVLGITTESLITKVIWNPPWEEGDNVTRILGLGVYEVGFIVLVWHAWMSLAVPLGLALTAFGHTEIFTPRQTRRLLIALPLTMVFGAAIQSPGLIPLALLGIPLNAAGILASAWLYRRLASRHPLRGLDDLRLARGERRVVWGMILLLYAVCLPLRKEAYPTLGPFVLGMLLMVGSIRLLIAVRHADRDQTPPPGEDRFTFRGFRRYSLYFGAASILAGGLALMTRPASTGLVLVLTLLILLRGGYYWLQLVRRVGLFRFADPRKRDAQRQMTQA